MDKKIDANKVSYMIFTGMVLAYQIMDAIDLNILEKLICEKNYECEMTMRFVAYRAICRPVNYRFIAPVEDLLNQDMEFRTELEGSIRSYFRIFINTSQHTRSFKKYETRIKEIGIKLPETIRMKIEDYFQHDENQNAYTSGIKDDDVSDKWPH